MRRGFTLIELMVATSISAIVMGAALGLFMAVWKMASESTDDMQCMLHARYQRVRLLYQANKTYGGMLSAYKVSEVDWGGKRYLKLEYPKRSKRAGEGVLGDPVQYVDIDEYELNRSLDSDHRKTFAQVYGPIPQTRKSVNFVYLAAKSGRSTYTERMIVPLYGKQLSPDGRSGMGMILNKIHFTGDTTAEGL